MNRARRRTTEEALALVSSFYPRSHIPPKVMFGVEEIMEQLAASGAWHAANGEEQSGTLKS